MDVFTGFKSAVTHVLPEVREVMDPFHVVALAGDKLDQCRRRLQRQTTGHRGRKDDPAYRARRLLHTGAGLLSDKAYRRLEHVFADEPHAAVEATWSVYHKIVSAYRAKASATGEVVMSKVIDTLSSGVPQALEELAEPDPTLNKRRTDILAYFDNPHTTGGPTEAINGRLEHLRGIALGFRNPNHYTTRSLI
ncbi:transposase [Actinomyces weissii]|uniref:Transposase n=1 Tax=Actinomyces weissii TaxID=675090 RepID=A0A7T7MAI4_9ACTO|nr:transposase [Actinomyces weissii]QQM67938.1 transposase [Actinomyces weissii]